MQIIFPETSGYIKDYDGIKYLTLIPANDKEKGKDALKQYEEMWDKNKYLIKTKNNTLDHYDE